MDIITRFVNKVECVDGHWMWTAPPKGGGYGQFWYEDRMRPAHVVSYILFVGPVDFSNGDIVHHRCRIKLCVRPMCLEKTDHKGNMAYERKEFCIRGHAMTEDNIYMNGWARVCRKCIKIRDDMQHGRIPRT